MSSKKLPTGAATELLQVSTDATVITDGDGVIIFVNREAENLFGYDANEMLGEPVEILMPESIRKHHKTHVNAFGMAPRSRPMVAGLKLLGRRKDGEHFRAEISLTPVKTEDGLLVASAIREIDAVDQSEAYFRTLLESAPDAMIIVDEDRDHQ